MKTIDSKVLWCSIFLLLACSHPLVKLYSQTPARKNEDEIVTRFDRAAAKHKEELRDLRHTRAAPEIRLPEVTLKSLSAVLANRAAASGVGYLARTNILFYSYDEGALSAWLVDESGVRAYDRRVLSQQQIGAVIANLRNSLGVESLQRARTPRKSNKSTVANSSSKPAVSVIQAASATTEILLPTSIAKALGERYDRP